ncbi:MAG: hypothetical protein HOD17_14015 [Desulfobacteraceae bacterium]|nr:hypothetical protein [Desulfobacteraceae bacterium]
MMDMKKMFDSLEVVIVGSDTDMNVIYANEKSRKTFKDMPNQGNIVGTSLTEYHKPETVEIIKSLFNAFRNKEKKLDYYKMELPGGKATVVQIPFYDNEEFAGAVEFIFESGLE